MLIDVADPFATAKPDARLVKLLIRARTVPWRFPVRLDMGPLSPRSEHYQFGGPVVSVSCSIATVTRRQIAAPA
jgi:hypothetical protein